MIMSLPDVTGYNVLYCQQGSSSRALRMAQLRSLQTIRFIFTVPRLAPSTLLSLTITMYTYIISAHLDIILYSIYIMCMQLQAETHRLAESLSGINCHLLLRIIICF
jgi:hypothetical protein